MTTPVFLVFGPYVLVDQLAQTNKGYTQAFAAYERQTADPVRRSRTFTRTVAQDLVPNSAAGV
nr:hypothetical protein [Mycobacterium uberis]